MGWGPKAPDMTASNAANAAGVAITQDQWEWTKARQPMLDKQTDDMIAMGRDQYELNRDGQVFQQGLAKKYDDRYWGAVAPMQDEMLADANRFDTNSRREELAGQAGADVHQAFDAAQGEMQRGMDRRGVNPSAGAAMAMNNAASMGEATAMANAMNKTRAAARAEGYGRKVDANAMMSGMSGFSSSATNAANAYGNNAGQAAGIGMGGLTAGAAGRANGANNAATGYSNAARQYNANAIESAKNPGFDFIAGLAGSAVKGWAGGLKT